MYGGGFDASSLIDAKAVGLPMPTTDVQGEYPARGKAPAARSKTSAGKSQCVVDGFVFITGEEYHWEHPAGAEEFH